MGGVRERERGEGSRGSTETEEGITRCLQTRQEGQEKEEVVLV